MFLLEGFQGQLINSDPSAVLELYKLKAVQCLVDRISDLLSPTLLAAQYMLPYRESNDSDSSTTERPAPYRVQHPQLVSPITLRLPFELEQYHKMPTIPLEIRHAFEKRDNMGYPIHPIAIVLLAMLGAGFVVCGAYAITSSYRTVEETEPPRSVSQDNYMREVRARNVDGIMAENYARFYQQPRRAPQR